MRTPRIAPNTISAFSAEEMRVPRSSPDPDKGAYSRWLPPGFELEAHEPVLVALDWMCRVRMCAYADGTWERHVYWIKHKTE